MNITHYELMQVANEFLEENYQFKMEIPINFNTRLKSTLGKFVFTKSKKIPLRIEMSVEAMSTRPKEQIIDILKHELVHYALCRLEKPFYDGQTYFENELKKLGISRTNSLEHVGKVHKYTCKNCNEVFERKRRINKGGRCGCTPYEENLIYNGQFNKRIENGEEIFEKIEE